MKICGVCKGSVKFIRMSHGMELWGHTAEAVNSYTDKGVRSHLADVIEVQS